MSLIKKSNEIAITKNVKMMVYGQAGAGKTTLALSAPRPLLLDFDNGVKRVNNEHLNDSVGIVQVSTWQDVISLITEEREAMKDYDTIVVDTIGKMMDYIINYRCGGRPPRIQDWGTINNDFKAFIQTLNILNKHIVFIAHRDTRKEGEQTVFIPALREKNYNNIVTELDLLGYLEMRAENGVVKRTLTFSPTDRNDGKNTCNLPNAVIVPTTIDKDGKMMKDKANNFISSYIIPQYQKMIADKEDKVKEYNATLEEIKTGVEQITDAQGANFFAEHIKDYADKGNSVIMYARNLFSDKVKSLNLVYDKETKKYSDAAA